MNETIQTLLSRRSVRKYRKEQISDEELKLIVKCGLYAPSGINSQSWRFVAVQSSAALERLENVCAQFSRRDSAFYGAPTVIIVFTDKNAATPVKDGALAIGNMANAAASLGIGSCWINCVNNLFETAEGAKLKAEIMPDENYTSVGSLALGYPDGEIPEAAPRRENTVTYLR